MTLRHMVLDLLDPRAAAVAGAGNEQRLSPHFTLDELTSSSRARAQGIDNRPGEREIAALRNLCAVILEPIRERFGAVIVSSGYRSRALNALVGGATRSQHVRGEAADIVVRTTSVTGLFQWIVLESKLPFDQVIGEFGRWVHVSAVPYGPPRAQALVTRTLDGKPSYDVVSPAEVKRMTP
jgi:zinc D-Ala-D-Ala carboxypeptidase